MTSQRFAAIALALFILPAVLVTAQEGPEAPDEAANPTRMVTFYPHVFAATATQPMPGNTQFPWGEDDFSAGYPGNGCYPDALAPLSAVPTLPPPGTVPPPPFTSAVNFPTCEDWGNNRLYVYSTAGFVHADQDTWSYEDFHNERGQAKDILLDTTQDITATFYMSADWHPWNCALEGSLLVGGVPSPYPCWNWDPGFFPAWQVEATFFLANMGEYQGQASDAPPVHEKILSGDIELVGTGLSETQDLLSLDESIGGPGEVYEFTINLGKPQVDRIPKEMDWVLMFRWWMKQGEDKVLLGQRFNWNINSGEFYPNRFQLPVKNPFDVELVYPQFLHDKLLIHAILNSPWGSYDVDSKTVRMTITGEGNRPVEPQRLQRVADFSVAHGGHYKPVNVTWVWDHRADQLAPGVYTVAVEAHNFQHSAAGRTEAQFRINPDGTGTVLQVGRSGQLTATSDQLGTLGGVQGQSVTVTPVPAYAGLVPLALAAMALGSILLHRRLVR